jgi:transcriptional regulator with PAS, ATPase and Fis domain
VFHKWQYNEGIVFQSQVDKMVLTARNRIDKTEELFFGETPAMREILELASATALNHSPVLITGETGTGKGILARWIHRQSARSNFEFVELNCSSLRGEMLSREIFGNVRGAFTSADQDRKGLLDIADQGTLFLDEIGDMTMDVQAQFLKVLEEKNFRRLGDVKLLKSNFRLICATHREIESLLQAGHFRQDLMYRINLLSIHIPPLRERMRDFPALVSYLLRTLGSSPEVMSDEVMNTLMNYTWPGNIRELKNVLERALLLTPRGEILRQSLFSGLEASRHHFPLTMHDLELAHISIVLKQMGGDIGKTWQSLGISQATLYRKLKQIRDADSIKFAAV